MRQVEERRLLTQGVESRRGKSFPLTNSLSPHAADTEPDPLSAATGIINAALVAIVLWAALIIVVSLMRSVL